MITSLNRIIDSLSLDHRRGAAEIVEDIAELLESIAKFGVKDPDTVDQIFERAIRRLARGQPTMAPVLNILNIACLFRERYQGDWEALAGVYSDLHNTHRYRRDKMIALVQELPNVDGVLLTFSNSSTISDIIIECHRQGWNNRVFCGEGRPIMEGLVLARKLTAAGVPVTVYTDAALMSRIIEADAVWVGGDSLSHQGLVNKVGSRALAMLAKSRKIPFISLMSSEKLLPPSLLPFFHCLPQNPREIAADDADELDVVNEYYENIPLNLVNFVFTEKGLSKPGAILETIKQEPVAKLFKELVQESR